MRQWSNWQLMNWQNRMSRGGCVYVHVCVCEASGCTFLCVQSEGGLLLEAEYKELRGSDRKGWEEWRTYEVDAADYDEDKRETGLQMLNEPRMDESNRLEESMSSKPQLSEGRQHHRSCHIAPSLPSYLSFAGHSHRCGSAASGRTQEEGPWLCVPSNQPIRGHQDHWSRAI